MTTRFDTPATLPLAPVARTERIQALDVVRGVALIGILLMNIEFFNRPISDLSSGMVPGQSGADLYFSYFVMYFVTGKFWTMFSLLFGMGFAVMLMRAESAQRSFLGPYLRRIAALAVFGALHYIFLWGGDILFSYAVAALCLLIVLYGKGKYILLSMGALAGLGVLAKVQWPYGIAGAVAYFSCLAWFLRCPDNITLFKRNVPIFKIVTRCMMVAGLGTIIASFVMPNLPHDAKFMMPYSGAMVLLLNILMVRYHDPVASRTWRMGVGMYTVMALMGTGAGAFQYYFPNPADAPVPVVATATVRPAAPVAKTAPTPVAKAATASAASATPAKPLTDAEKAAERRKRRAEGLAEFKADRAKEIKVLTTGGYADVVALRAPAFFERAPDQFGFATMVASMFLIGLWFVKSGVMANTGAHLPLFRKLAFIALPLGIGLGLLGSLIATHSIPGQPNGFMFASSLLRLGNLPACLGYVAAIVLMLHSRSLFSSISLLAPFGRMALTNYLTHSLILSTIFYGYGFGMFGMGRSAQMAWVVAILLAQIPLSTLWLTHFRYGPVEWLWRAITYWQIPPLRVASAGSAGLAHPA